MDKTAALFNRVLKEAGVDPSELSVLSCQAPQGPCEVQIQENQKDRRETFSRVEDFFVFVNDDFLNSHPGAAKNRGKSSLSLFRPLSPEWVVVDTDKDPFTDGILNLGGDGWTLSPVWVEKGAPQQVVEKILKLSEVFLSPEERKNFAHSASGLGGELGPLAWILGEVVQKDWSDAGLTATPAAFEARSYPFSVATQADSPTFISPFHRVTLKGNPDLEIPWSDPYLIMEWHAFLRRNGVRIIQNEKRTDYTYRGFTFLQSEDLAGERVFRLLSPLGEVRREMRIPLQDPKIGKVLSDKEGRNYSVDLEGQKIEIVAHLPADFPTEQKEAAVREVAASLLQIPKVWRAPLLAGVGEEKPIRIFLADKEMALREGWLNQNHSEIAAATYSSHENRVWVGLTPEGKGKPGVLYHEVAGHALADFEVPEDNAATLVDSPAYALQNYYRWKLTQTFSAEELKSYGDLSRKYAKWRQGPKTDVETGENFEKLIIPFRERAKKRFVSHYAVEGPDGIPTHLADPGEDFAEVMMFWMDCMMGTRDWAELRDQEPMLQLVGLDYLFGKYGATRIGELKPEEVFTNKGFQKALGIQMGETDEVLREAGFLPKAATSTEWLFPLTAGIEYRRDGIRGGWAPWVGLQAGYQKGNLGVGISLDYLGGAASEPASVDGGIWFRSPIPIPGIQLFWEPSLGLRVPWGGNEDPSVWIGNRAVLELFQGRVGITLDQKLGLGEGGGSNVGLGLRFSVLKSVL